MAELMCVFHDYYKVVVIYMVYKAYSSLPPFLWIKAFLSLSRCSLVMTHLEGCTPIGTLAPLALSLATLSTWMQNLSLYTAETLPSWPFLEPRTTRTSSSLLMGNALMPYCSWSSLERGAESSTRRSDDGAVKYAFLAFLLSLDTSRFCLAIGVGCVAVGVDRELDIQNQDPLFFEPGLCMHCNLERFAPSFVRNSLGETFFATRWCARVCWARSTARARARHSTHTHADLNSNATTNTSFFQPDGELENFLQRMGPSDTGCVGCAVIAVTCLAG